MSIADELRQVSKTRTEQAEESRQQSLADAEFARKRAIRKAELDELARRTEEDAQRAIRAARESNAARAAQEPPPPIETVVKVVDSFEVDGTPEWAKLNSRSMRGMLDHDIVERASGRRDTLALIARDAKLAEAVKIVEQFGIFPVGHLCDGTLIVRSRDTGITHAIDGADRLSYHRLLLVAGANALRQLQLDEQLFGADPQAAENRKLRDSVVGSVAVLCGLVRLPGTRDEVLGRIEADDAAHAKAMADAAAGRAAEAAAAEQAAAQSLADESAESDDEIDFAEIIGKK